MSGVPVVGYIHSANSAGFITVGGVPYRTDCLGETVAVVGMLPTDPKPGEVWRYGRGSLPKEVDVTVVTPPFDGWEGPSVVVKFADGAMHIEPICRLLPRPPLKRFSVNADVLAESKKDAIAKIADMVEERA